MLQSRVDAQPQSSGIKAAPPSSGTGVLPRLRMGTAEIVTLCIYTGLLAWAIPHHELFLLSHLVTPVFVGRHFLPSGIGLAVILAGSGRDMQTARLVRHKHQDERPV